MSIKKNKQLGMNHSTASNRLVKDLLFSFIEETGKNECYHCGKTMLRDTFSIEHKEPWLDSKNPLELFFDKENISFSHRSCNYRAARRYNQKYFSNRERMDAKNKQKRDKRAGLVQLVE